MKKVLFLLFALAGGFAASASDFVTARDGKLYRNGEEYLLRGVNFPQAVHVAAADSARLLRELDSLSACRLTHVRLLVPCDTLNEALDLVLAALGERGMTATLVLATAAPWDLAEHVGCDTPIPVEKAARTNLCTGQAYSADPTILAYELMADAPPTDSCAKALLRAAKALRTLAPNTLIVSGMNGATACETQPLIYEKLHASSLIDILTLDFFPLEYDWTARSRLYEDLPYAYLKAREAAERVARFAENWGKPVYVSAVAYPRDHNFYSPSSTVNNRSTFFRMIPDMMEELRRKKLPLSGFLFWVWGGEAPFVDKEYIPGAPLTGDPPTQPQGKYNIYMTDLPMLF